MSIKPDEKYSFTVGLTYIEIQEILRFLFDDVFRLRRELVTAESQKDSYGAMLKELGIDREIDNQWWSKFEKLKELVKKNDKSL